METNVACSPSLPSASSANFPQQQQQHHHYHQFHHHHHQQQQQQQQQEQRQQLAVTFPDHGEMIPSLDEEHGLKESEIRPAECATHCAPPAKTDFAKEALSKADEVTMRNLMAAYRESAKLLVRAADEMQNFLNGASEK